MVKVIVGMMGSSVASGSSKMATREQVTSFLSVVKKHGVKEIDTARVYNAGKSEELLGDVSAWKDFAISTKAPAFAPKSLSEKNIIDNCEKSIKALKQDQVDIYYLHGPDRSTELDEQCRAINALHQQGRLKRFGVSNISDAEVQQIHDICSEEGYVLPSVYQGGYNPIGRGAELTLFPLLKKLNMSFYAFSPLGGGLLAKPVDELLKPAKGTRFDEMKVFGDIYLTDQILGQLKKVQEACDKENVPLMEATLRWFMHHSPLGKDDGFILGASSEQQIERSLDATEKGPLPDALAAAWEGMWTEIRKQPPQYHN